MVPLSFRGRISVDLLRSALVRTASDFLAVNGGASEAVTVGQKPILAGTGNASRSNSNTVKPNSFIFISLFFCLKCFSLSCRQELLGVAGNTGQAWLENSMMNRQDVRHEQSGVGAEVAGETHEAEPGDGPAAPAEARHLTSRFCYFACWTWQMPEHWLGAR
jgi:hypothetical protein